MCVVQLIVILLTLPTFQDIKSIFRYVFGSFQVYVQHTDDIEKLGSGLDLENKAITCWSSYYESAKALLS